MMESDRAKGSIRILKGEHGYGFEVNGDVNSYLLTDAIGTITKANIEQRQIEMLNTRQDFLIKAGTTFLSAIVAIGLFAFLFGGGCSRQPSYQHPTQTYQGNY